MYRARSGAAPDPALLHLVDPRLDHVPAVVGRAAGNQLASRLFGQVGLSVDVVLRDGRRPSRDPVQQVTDLPGARNRRGR
jgi:hypothetical protein